jgi:hypothetical protein
MSSDERQRIDEYTVSALLAKEVLFQDGNSNAVRVIIHIELQGFFRNG